jgi:CubicO group peptidase (beta-lactamase class C family)
MKKRKSASVLLLRLTYRFQLFSLCLLLLSPPLSAQQAEKESGIDLTELEKVATKELEETNTPGAAVAIISGDRVIFTRGFGVASIETGDAVTSDMLFRLGSTTKMFTGAALVTLSEAEKIKLDAPIGNYARGLSPALSKLTSHHLISNNAGMADFQAPFVSHDDAALAKMVREWKDDVLFTDPGKIYSYSSAGFWLAGYVIEEAAGKPYADAMDELLFRPLGMLRTTFRPLVAMTYPLATGHNAQGSDRPAVIRPAFNNVAMWPAGSIYSSAGELSRFVIALLNGGRLEGKQTLSRSLIAKLMGKHVEMPGDPDVHYGYGLLTLKHRGASVVMHGGFSRGYGSMIQMVPERRFAIIVLTNKSGETLAATRAKAMDLVLALRAPEDEAPKTAMPMSEAEMRAFAGKYKNGPQTWEIFMKGESLYLRQGSEEVQLTRTAERRLSFGRGLANDLVFVPGGNGRPEHLFDGLYSARRIQ